MKIKKIFGFCFVFIFLFFMNSFIVFAGRTDDNEDSNATPDNIIAKSDFDGGYIEKKWETKSYNGDVLHGRIRYYKYVYGKYNGELVSAWLYDLSSKTQDEELKNMIQDKENDTQQLLNIFASTGKIVDNPEIYTSQYFMWPVSSNGEYVLTDENSMKQAVLKHDIHDFSQVSNPDNFCLSSIFKGNWDSTLSNNLPNYTYPVSASKSYYNSLLQQANAKTGQSYSNKFNLNGTNRHFVNTSQTFLTHASYLTEGSQAAAVAKTLMATNNYDPSKDTINTNKKEKSYYENQYFFFLTTPDGQHVTPQKVFSANIASLLLEDNVMSFPRSTSAALQPRLFGDITPKQIYQSGNGPIQNVFNFGLGTSAYNVALNNIVKNYATSSSLSAINWKDVPPEFILTFQSLIYTYKGAYWKLTDLATKTYGSDLTTVFPEFNQMLSIDDFIKMGTTNYEAHYKMSQILTLVMAKFYLISGFASPESPATLTYLNAPSGTSYGSYDLPVLTYDSVPNTGNVSTGNVRIANETIEDTNSSIIVIDLPKALGIDNKSYGEFKLKFDQNNSFTGSGIAFFDGNKRAGKLLNFALNKKWNSIYLTNSECEKGLVNLPNETLQTLYPYVVKVGLLYEKKIPEISIPKIISKDSIYDISNYKNVDLYNTKKDTTTPTTPNNTPNNTTSNNTSNDDPIWDVIDDDPKETDPKEEEKTDPKDVLTNILNEMTFPLFMEQVHMRTTNPKVQFMSIYSDVEGYGSKETAVFTNAKKYLNNIDQNLYKKTFSDVTTMAKNYYPEIYWFSGTPLIDHNMIRFMPTTGKTISGLTALDEGNTNARQFDFIETDYSTTSADAQTKLLSRTLNSGASVSFSRYDGDLISRNGSFDMSSNDAFGYFNLKNSYSTGTLSLENMLEYYGGFVIPNTAGKYTGGKLYLSDKNGNVNSGSVDFYPTNASKTSLSGATDKAKNTQGVKIIARIATHDNGDYGIFEDYSGYSGKMQEVVNYMKQNYMAASGINNVTVTTGTETGVKINGGNLVITVSDDNAKEAFGKEICNYFTSCLGKASKKDKDKITAIFSTLNLTDAYKLLGVDGITSVWVSMLVEDSYKADDITYISGTVESGSEDLLISNGLNSLSGNLKVTDRTSIDWTNDSESTYNITARFNSHNDSNILDTNNAIKTSEQSKLKAKNYDTNPKTDSATVYGEVYVGRIPEAMNQGLTLGMFDVMMYEKYNNLNKDGSSGMDASKFDELSKLIALKNSLKDGTSTASTLQGYLDKFPSAYKSGILYNLALGKQSLGNFSINPVAYKVANNITLSNGRINGKATMSNWNAISGSLDNIVVSPGMVIKYEYSYHLPYGSESTTVKYIQNRPTVYNTLDDISALELDYVLIPKVNSDGSIKDTKAITYDLNSKNNYNKLGTSVSDGGNMKFTELTIKNKRTGAVIGTYTSANTDGTSLNIDLPSNAFVKANASDPNSKFDDLVLSVKVKYENFVSPDGEIVHQNKATVGVENTFYDTAKVASVNASSKTNGFKSGTIMNYNENYSDTQYMIVPLSQVDVNSSQGKYIKLTCPEIDPRCLADNMNSTDWEYINIYANNPADRDNAVVDIILAKDGNFSNNDNILGENNEGSIENLMNQSLLTKALAEADQSLTNIGAVVKVKRLAGNNLLENKYKLYLTSIITADGQSYTVETSSTSYVPQIGQYTGGKDKLQNSGDYIYFVFPNIRSGEVTDGDMDSSRIQRVNVTANYRLNDEDKTYYDGLDYDTTNNVRQEQWGNGFNISVSVEHGEDLTIPAGSSVTDPTNVTINGEINTYINNSEIYNMESIMTNTTVYLEHMQTGKKYYPQKVDPIETWGAGSGSASYNISGESVGVSMDFGDLSLPEGGYKAWLKVKPNQYQLVEEIPWNEDYTKTDNIAFGEFNVGRDFDDGTTLTEEQVCPSGTTVTENKWNVRFRWTNKVLARPKVVDKWKKSKDGEYFVCCFCRNRSGRNNGKSNWGPYGDAANYYANGDGPYYERITAEVQLYTSSIPTWTRIGSSANVYTGESFKLRVVVKHSSNRDVLPNAPYVDQMGYDTPYSQTYSSSGHVGPCEYLRRNPNYSSVAGAQRLLYTISGTSGYDRTMYRTADQKSGGGVNRTSIWNILPEINVPLTNKKQTISVSYAVQAYNGHKSDPLHPKKQLCTTGSAKIQILPSITVVGDEEQKDQGVNSNAEAGVE